MTIRVAIYPEGTRIQVSRGQLPMDPHLIDRIGTVIELSLYRPGRYGVVLDGEDRVREFREDELSRVEA